MAKTILCLGDIHFPFQNHRALKTVFKIAEQIKPDVIVQIGDLLDLISFSRFPRSLNHLTPKKELELGLEDASNMWASLRKASPKSKCFQLIGNHDERLSKAVLISLPSAESLFNIQSLLSFPKVETMSSEREELIIDDTIYMHGFRSKLGDHARHNGMSTVVGHSHHGGTHFHRLGDRILFELNCGFLADADSYALSYTRQRRISNWTLGVGLIDELGPRFIPFGG